MVDIAYIELGHLEPEATSFSTSTCNEKDYPAYQYLNSYFTQTNEGTMQQVKKEKGESQEVISPSESFRKGIIKKENENINLLPSYQEILESLKKGTEVVNCIALPPEEYSDFSSDNEDGSDGDSDSDSSYKEEEEESEYSNSSSSDEEGNDRDEDSDPSYGEEKVKIAQNKDKGSKAYKPLKPIVQHTGEKTALKRSRSLNDIEETINKVLRVLPSFGRRHQPRFDEGSVRPVCLFDCLTLIQLSHKINNDPNDKIDAKLLNQFCIDESNAHLIDIRDLVSKTDYRQIADSKQETKRCSGNVDLIKLYLSIKKSQDLHLFKFHNEMYSVLSIKSIPKPTLSPAKLKKLIRNNINYKIKDLIKIYPHLEYYCKYPKDWCFSNVRRVPEVLLYTENKDLRRLFRDNNGNKGDRCYGPINRNAS